MSLLLAGLGIVGSVANGIIGGSRAKKAMRKARAEKKRLTRRLESLENQRQDIVNPYADSQDLSSMITDLSGSISNPFANLGVATKAAEMQTEQADIALANSLDTIRATGAGAGGATALAQAALQSKKGVTASIETQEAANEKARAQGEQNMQQRKMQEQQRVQGLQSSLRSQYQQMMGQGEAFQMQLTSQQEQSQIDRTAAQLAGQVRAESQAAAAETSALTGAISGMFGSAISAFSGENENPTENNEENTTQGSGSGSGGGVGSLSDRRLKNNIKLISKSNSGLNIYSFEYINKNFGEGVYQGVMSDEIPKEAIIKHEDGFDRVDYSKLDVEFKLI